MSIGNYLLRWALGNDRAPDRLDVALFNGPVEVADPGYKRSEASKGTWRITNESAQTVATFGPLQGTIEFDRSVIFKGNVVVHEKRLEGGGRKSGRSDVIRVEVDVDLKELA